jgi:hypothetical protein
MMNTDMIVAQARNNQVPPTWQVHHGRSSFYVRQIAIGAFLLAFAAAGAIYLVSHPFIAIVPGYAAGDSNVDSQTFTLDRAVDFVLLGLFALVGIGAMIRYLLELGRAYQHVLVLLPEGFVLSTGKTVAYAYGTIREMKLVKSRYASSLKIHTWNAQKPVRVRLDGRFGNPKQLTGTIYTMWKNCVTIAPAMRQPSWY